MHEAVVVGLFGWSIKWNSVDEKFRIVGIDSVRFGLIIGVRGGSQ